MSDGKPLATYHTSQLRISFVWRSRCFASEEEKARFATDQDTLSLEGVLSDLVVDLRKRYVVTGYHDVCLCICMCMVCDGLGGDTGGSSG